MDGVFVYLIIGALMASILSLNSTQDGDGVFGYPKNLFTKFEYFLVVTCWPLVFILILCVRILNILKDKIL